MSIPLIQSKEPVVVTYGKEQKTYDKWGLVSFQGNITADQRFRLTKQWRKCREVKKEDGSTDIEFIGIGATDDMIEDLFSDSGMAPVSSSFFQAAADRVLAMKKIS